MGNTILDLQARSRLLPLRRHGQGRIHLPYDIANIDNKNFSEKITTAPVSPWGQRFFVKTKYATAVGSPSTLAVDPLRQPVAEDEETPSRALFFGFLCRMTDLEEGSA